MDLNVVDSAVHNPLIPQFLGNHGRVHNACLDPHGQQIVRVAAEGLAVEEISPASDHLARNQSQNTGVCHAQKGLLLYPCIHSQRQNRPDDSAIDGQAAGSQIENLDGVVLVQLPVENHIVQPRSDNGKNDGIEGKVQVKVRVLTSAPGVPHGHPHARQHSQSDDDAVKSHPEAENTDAVSHMFNGDAQMDKTQICSVHLCLTPLLLPILLAAGGKCNHIPHRNLRFVD